MYATRLATQMKDAINVPMEQDMMHIFAPKNEPFKILEVE